MPLQISYQGRVTDAGGAALGSPTPVNRVVTFRIWSHATDATAGNRLYTEQQTVTIANGDFSVLIGNGTVVAGEAKPALDTVFTGAVRFLGVTVDDGTTTADPEISPRQQIVTDAYAFRAKVAESVLASGITTAMIANNAVTAIQIADSAVGSAKITDASIVAADLADAAVTSAKILDGTIGTVDLAGGSVTQAKLGSDVGIWTTASGNGNVWRGTGNVGINTGWPAALLSVGGNLVNSKILVQDDGNAGNNTGFGYQSNQFRFHVGNSAAKFSFLNAPAGPEIFTVLGNGNVGIGHTTPTAPLTIFREQQAYMVFQHNTSGAGTLDGLHVGSHGTASYVWNYEPTPLQLGTNGAERLRIEADGRMGFNGANGNSTIGYTFKSSGEYLMVLYDRNSVWSYSFHEAGSAVKPGGGSWGNSSDLRLKKNIANLSGSLERLLRLRSVTYDYKDEKYGKGRHTGFIAQEVREIFPDWVSVERDGFLAVGTKGFEAQAVEAFRELRAEKDAQIAALQAQVKELKGENTTVAQRLDALERRLNATSVTANSPR